MYGSSWFMQSNLNQTTNNNNIPGSSQSQLLQQQQQRTLTNDSNFYNFNLLPLPSFSFSNFDNNNKQQQLTSLTSTTSTNLATNSNHPLSTTTQTDFSLAASFDNQLFLNGFQNDDLMIPIDWNFTGAGTPSVRSSKSENHIDRHHNTMIKLYEEEEKNIEFEIKQDEKLLIVLEEEAQLTRQLSVEHFAHLNELDYVKSKMNGGSFLSLRKSDDKNVIIYGLILLENILILSFIVPSNNPKPILINLSYVP